jgi:hypothetical protein
MIEVYIKHRKCGHRSMHRLSDDTTPAEVENLFYGACPECAATATGSLFGRDEVPEEAPERRLPLQGTAKQVAWALGIREDRLREADTYVQTLQRWVQTRAATQEDVRSALDALEFLEGLRHAHTWIDTREWNIGYLLNRALACQGSPGDLVE